MLFLLPEEGTAPEYLLDDPQAVEFLSSFSRNDRAEDEESRFEEYWKQNRYVILHFSVPKFDISQECSLKAGFQELGLGGLFQPGKADFSPLVKKSSFLGLPWGADDCALNEVTQASRLMIDEKGCTASSFVSSMPAGASAPPSEEVEFTLDRPFLFVLLSNNDLPIYMGIVNHPN